VERLEEDVRQVGARRTTLHKAIGSMPRLPEDGAITEPPLHVAVEAKKHRTTISSTPTTRSMRNTAHQGREWKGGFVPHLGEKQGLVVGGTLLQNLLSNVAFGFRSNRGTLHAAQVVSNAIHLQRRRRQRVWLASFDLTKCVGR
jgi:hypothetical protein